MRHLRAASCAAALAVLTMTTAARAQPADGGGAPSAEPAQPTREEPDPTRLDVERLPPEAIKITRDLYAHGIYLEAHLGTLAFLGGVGRLSRPGFLLTTGIGYEVKRWLWVEASFEGSIHRTDAPPPPSTTSFEVLGFIGEVRLQADLSARAALWAGGQIGLTIVPSDVLTTYGLNDSNSVGFTYGGDAGFDWHLPSRHHSLGLSAGARLYPALNGPTGELAIGVHGTAYIRYVF